DVYKRQGLRRQGWSVPDQGIWIQVGQSVVAEHRGSVLMPAASLTKLATTLAALQTWPLDHRFDTLVGLHGTLQSDGVLDGDLVIQGSGDPLFVWEEGIALANRLQELGIQRVTGEILVTGPFTMNFEEDQAESLVDLKQAMATSTWTWEARQAYANLAPGTPQPNLQIDGVARWIPTADLENVPIEWVVRHQSLPLVAILKAMNIYSNNVMAEMVAELVGGPAQVMAKATELAELPAGELSLANGSGLGVENQMSARVAGGPSPPLLKPAAWPRLAPWLGWCPPPKKGRCGSPLSTKGGISLTCGCSRISYCRRFRPTGEPPKRPPKCGPRCECRPAPFATATPAAIRWPRRPRRSRGAEHTAGAGL
ncbi:hypothetical protein C8B47_31265, partial [filamentous cyanobacterium CCP4]